MIHVPGSGDHHVPRLRVPAEDHLRVGLAVLRRQSREDGLVDQGLVPVAQRIPRHQRGPDGPQERFQLRLREVRMRLHLHERRPDLRRVQDLLQLLLREVRHAQGPDLPGPHRPFHGLVRAHIVPCGLVQEQQIHIVRVQTAERGVDRAVRLRVHAGPQLRAQIHVLPRQTGTSDPASHGPLVQIAVGGVHHPIPVGQGVVHGLFRRVRLHQESADPDEGDPRPVVQIQVSHRSHLDSLRPCSYDVRIIAGSRAFVQYRSVILLCV